MTSSSASSTVRRRSRGRRVVRGVGETSSTVMTTATESQDTVPDVPMPPAPAEDGTDGKGEATSAAPKATRSRSRRRAKADSARKERIDKLASEIFLDPGVPAPQEPEDADGDARIDSDDVQAARPRVRRRRSQVAARRSETENQTAERESAAAEQSADGGDAPSARARRARSAVSQILEFSSPASTQPGRAHTAGNRSMMSLLFQEPAPTVPAKPESDERDSFEEEATTRSRRRRRRSSSAEDRETRESRESLDDRADDNADDDQPRSGRSRRSRRMNAQERRAAAEVEQIETDLEYDDIDYRPIEDEHRDGGSASGSVQEPAEEVPTRSRRRRRRHEEEAEAESEEATTVTRRRRRRRGAKSEEEKESIPRSRKQQYIDEITDIEGSTRLEAKKQRRRDNRRDRSRQTLITEQDFLSRRESVNRIMVVREKERHTQISVIEDNTLVEHYVSDIQEVSSVGNIYLGRVQNVLPSMEAAFVDIGQARNGVLYAGEVNWDTTRLEGQPRRIELAFKSGDPVLVQVTKDPIGHKGARLTSQVTLAGRFLVLVPSGGMTGVSRKLPAHERARLKSIVSKIAPKDMGVIIRTAAEGASEDAIVKDLEHLRNQWEHITAKQQEYQHSRKPHLLQGEPDVAIRVVRDIFNDDFGKLVVQGDKVYDRIAQYLESTAPDLLDRLEKWNPEEHGGKDVFDKWSIDSQLRKGMERKVYLPSGGSLVIDRTEAMTTIDVNTGRYIGRGKSLEETVTRCNLEAAEEIVRQLRLRDIGGMIMIDFVDMVLPANRDLVLRRLVECLSRDRTKHQVAEVTSLGLVQMTRKRVGQGLVEAFSEECPTCKGRGFILHDEPIVSASYDDPYALKGGDPFVKTNKHNHGTQVPEHEIRPASTAAVKAKLAQIAAAAQAASGDDRVR